MRVDERTKGAEKKAPPVPRCRQAEGARTATSGNAKRHPPAPDRKESSPASTRATRRSDTNASTGLSPRKGPSRATRSIFVAARGRLVGP